jgi:cell division septation protein DedD
MSTYRLSLGVPAVLSLVGSVAVMGGLLFLGGALIGFSAQPPARVEHASGGSTLTSVSAAATVQLDACVQQKAAAPAFKASQVESTMAPEPAPAAAPAQAPAAHETASHNRYSVQVGAFRQPESVRSMIALLRHRGYEPVVVPQRMQDGDILRSVRIADGEDWNEARSLGREFMQKEQMDAVIVLARQ